MKTFEEDKKLKSVVKTIKLDSPKDNFTVRVMNKIFQEVSVLEKLKNERIFGKSFWIILAMFIMLFGAMAYFAVNGATNGENLPKLLGDINSSGAVAEYQTILQRLGTFPLSIAGILIASSFLLFFDRFLNSKKFSTK